MNVFFHAWLVTISIAHLIALAISAAGYWLGLVQKRELLGLGCPALIAVTVTIASFNISHDAAIVSDQHLLAYALTAVASVWSATVAKRIVAAMTGNSG